MPKCRKRKSKSANYSNDIFGKQETKHGFFTPRYSNAFKTVCAVNVHPEDRDNILLGKAVRHVGTGIPKITTLPQQARDYKALNRVRMKP